MASSVRPPIRTPPVKSPPRMEAHPSKSTDTRVVRSSAASQPAKKKLRLPSCQTLSTPMSTKLHQMIPMLARTSPLRFFFLLHAAKVRSSCEEGPGQSALQSAYHNPKLDVTELKQNRTPYCSGQKLQSNKLTKQKPIKPTP